MVRTKRVESPTCWDVAADKPVTGFEPRVEGAEPSNKNDDWWNKIEFHNHEPRIEGAEPSNRTEDWFKKTTDSLSEATTVEAGTFTVSDINDVPGETLTLAPAGKAIEFKQAYPFTIDTDNINNMNDVRHIIKLLQIGLTEEVAMKLPLHLIKENDN